MTALHHGVGVALPTIDHGAGTPVLAAARRAEAAGLDHVWVPDHLVFHRPILESVTTLAMIAAVTERPAIGFAIINPVLRSVTWLAKQLATISALSPDRLMVGVGAGGEYPPEFIAAGIDPATRGQRLNEALELLPRLMAGEAVVHQGLLEVDCPGLAPAAPGRPPILSGGRAEVALRRAARYADAWFPMWLDPAEIAAGRERLAELCAEQGRAGVPGTALVAFVNICDDPVRGRDEAASHIRRQYGLPFDKVERWALIGPAAHVAERLAAYRDAGVEGFCLSPAAADPLTQIELIGELTHATDDLRR